MSKTVLVIDDSPSVRTTLSSLLALHGFDVIVARDGIEGTEALAANSNIEAVVCDINMPRMDGLKTLQWAKRRAGTKEVPFLMLTTERKSQMIRQAKDSGAAGWMVKPFEPNSLVAAVKKLVA